MSSATEEKQKPLDIDQLLKQMLLQRPELMAELKKSVPAKEDLSTPKVHTPREKKAPSKDFFLQVYSGCETCHAVTITTYNMKWDAIAGLFRPKVFSLREETTIDSEIKTQSITSRTCTSCASELGRLDRDSLVKLLINLTEPEFSIVRLVHLKRKIKELLK